MELLILGAIVLIGLIFLYEFLQINPRQSTASKILTADEVSLTDEERIRARSILKNLKNANDEAEDEKKSAEAEKETEEILPDPFSNQETKK